LGSRDAYTAIADPTRREILDLLLVQGVLPAGEIARHFSSASRPGISRHLRVLRECGVVRVERNGKIQNYTLNAEPLNAIQGGWLARFGSLHAKSLSALRRRVEGERRKGKPDRA
jgi:DNA-binding transcriptional ArsR family regulator